MFQRNNKKNLLLLIFLVTISPPTAFAQFSNRNRDSSESNYADASYVNPEGAPDGVDPVETPIDASLWILVLMGLGLGVFKMQSKTIR